MNPATVLLVIAACLITLGILWFIARTFKAYRSRRNSPVLKTGLKAIDLFTPLRIGGDVLISGDKGSGCKLLGTEIAFRLLNHPRRKFRVVCYVDEKLADIDAQVAELKESLPTLNDRYVVSVVTASDLQGHLSRDIPDDGVAIFAVSTNERFVHFFHEAVRTVRESLDASKILTCFVVTESFVPPGFDVTIISSQIVAKEGIYPALDLNASSSSVSSHTTIASTQRHVTKSAGEAIKNVQANLYPGALANPNWVFNREEGKRVAVQALRFMSQPYFVAEPYTGKTAAYVSDKELVKGFQTILSGKFMDAKPQSLQFVNALTPQR
ncbi:MAG: hypothetical protein R3C17_07300 [Planctomycetaceae bacterium]